MAALNDLSFYTNRSLGGIGAEEINSPQAQAMLAELRKYDPNAYFRPTQVGESGNTSYTLDFDGSKIPGYDPNAITTTGVGFNGRDFNWANDGGLKDPNAVTQSDLFGTQTQRSNLTPQQRDWFDYVGPLAVAAFGFGIGGIPGLTEGFGAQFQAPGYGGVDLSGLGASDPFLQGGTGAMDQMGSYGTGLPGSLGANAPLGSAESSLFGTGVQADPASAFGGGQYPLLDTTGDSYLGLEGAGTQAAAPISDLSTPARVGDVIRNGGIPGLDNIGQSLSELLSGSNLANLARGIPGLLGGGSGGGGGGGGLLAMQPRPQLQYEDLTKILGRFYGRA